MTSAIEQGAMRMNVQPYDESDLEAVASLFTASVHTLAANHYDPVQRAAWAPQPPDLDEWRQRLSAVETLVMKTGAGLAGFVAYNLDGHIELLFTSPDQARSGVASALMGAVELVLVPTGITAMYTEASLVARPFFARHGFRVVEEQVVVRRGVAFRRFAMQKSVSYAS